MGTSLPRQVSLTDGDLTIGVVTTEDLTIGDLTTWDLIIWNLTTGDLKTDDLPPQSVDLSIPVTLSYTDWNYIIMYIIMYM